MVNYSSYCLCAMLSLPQIWLNLYRVGTLAKKSYTPFIQRFLNQGEGLTTANDNTRSASRFLEFPSAIYDNFILPIKCCTISQLWKRKHYLPNCAGSVGGHALLDTWTSADTVKTSFVSRINSHSVLQWLIYSNISNDYSCIVLTENSGENSR